MVDVIPISNLQGYDPAEFCVTPSYWGYKAVRSYEVDDTVLEEAKKKADLIHQICFIKVTDDDTGCSYVIENSCNKGRSSKFLLLNAAETTRAKGQIFAVTFNTGRGALTRYLLEKYLKYDPGSEF